MKNLTSGGERIFPGIVYGGDYNPEQWLDEPEILAEDIRMLKDAHINCVTLGVFSWDMLEPEEGIYRLEWLEEIVDNLFRNGIRTILATPSGARPRWLSERYPEVLRVRSDRTRMLFGERHNHCYTSPVFRRKVQEIDARLARTFGQREAVIAWHISNEFSGECHCPLCAQAFRDWLEKKYGTVERLNKAWWTRFWSHSYQSFSQVESPSPIGDNGVHGLNLDWKRFVTAQTADFLAMEIRTLRMEGALQPCTTNLMKDFTELDYTKMAGLIDFVSWDNYPYWHQGNDTDIACETAMQHDFMRSLKHKPFFMMESSPSVLNWMDVSKVKRPGMLALASQQAVAHGSDSVQFFQIRQGRGGFEKFHGAVIDHYGKEDTRVFSEVKALGEGLERLSCIAGSGVKAPVAIVTDMESRWAMEDAMGPRNAGLHYYDTLLKNYRAFREAGVNVDLIHSEESLSDYQIVAVPMLYLMKEGVEKRFREFVTGGGILIMSYWSGIVNETDLCHLGGVPHGLTDVLGLRTEEIDALPEGECNHMVSEGKRYVCENLCELVRVDGARVLMRYEDEFYAGYPALTVKSTGEGKAYYICADAEQDFYRDLYRTIAEERGILPLIPDLPADTWAASREDGRTEYIFIGHYAPDTVTVRFPEGAEVLLGSREGVLKGYDSIILKREKA